MWSPQPHKPSRSDGTAERCKLRMKTGSSTMDIWWWGLLIFPGHSSVCGGFIKNKSGFEGGWRWQQGIGGGICLELKKKVESMRKQLPGNQNQSCLSIYPTKQWEEVTHIIQYHVMKSNLFFQWMPDSPTHPWWWLASVPSNGVWGETVPKWWTPSRKSNCSLKWSKQQSNKKEKEQCP